MKRHMVFDIGCMECGEESAVVGFYASRDEADAARRDYLDGGTSWGRTGWVGQHSVEVFEVDIA